MALVRLREVITVNELLKRWPSVTEKQLAKMIENGALKAYSAKGVRVKPGDNGDVYKEISGEPPHSSVEHFFDIPEGIVYYDFSGYVFNREEILEYEHKHLGHDIQVEINSKTKKDAKAISKQRCRKRGEITQKQAAALCYVSPRTFQNWENGTSRPPIDGMPTRDSAVVFIKWTLTLAEHIKLKDAITGVKRARPMSPSDIDKLQRRSPFADDLDGEADQCPGTGGGRRVTNREADDD